MRFAVLVAALAACRSQTAVGPTQSVIALAGPTAAEGGATIVSHDADGTVLDSETADATGHADVVYEPGAYVSAVFPALIDPLPTDVTVVTTPETGSSADLIIHGPPHVLVPVTVASLTIAGSAEPGAAMYRIDLGCDVQMATALPAVVGVVGQCESAQQTVDVLVQALDSSGAMLGYAAGRAPIGPDQAGNSVAELDVATWQTTGTLVPVTDGTGGAAIALTLISDELAFQTPAIADGEAMLWDGLVADSSIVTAAIGAQAALQYGSGAPSAIAIGSADFMGAIAAPALADTTTIGATWPAVTLAGPDALELELTWSSSVSITWDAVLPSDATAIAFPQLDNQAVPLPSDASAVSGQLTAIDSSALDGFAALQAAGIYDYDQIVPTPGSGEIRTSTAPLP